MKASSVDLGMHKPHYKAHFMTEFSYFLTMRYVLRFVNAIANVSLFLTCCSSWEPVELHCSPGRLHSTTITSLSVFFYHIPPRTYALRIHICQYGGKKIKYCKRHFLSSASCLRMLEYSTECKEVK